MKRPNQREEGTLLTKQGTEGAGSTSPAGEATPGHLAGEKLHV